MSVGASSSGSSTSIRATSIATLPLPTTTAREHERSNSASAKSGWPLYQATNSVAATDPWRSSPGDAEAVVERRADRVDDRVVALEQLLARDVGAELDAAEEAKARLRSGPLIDARDRLDLRMVGRDAGANQAIRRRQHVVEVDLEALLEQLIGRVEAGRAGADDRGTQRHRVEDDSGIETEAIT